jgi:phenol 2-monooxygenase
MQFYLNGYKPGDPFVEDPHPSVAERPVGLPEETDVLIIKCGPAGLVMGAQMANFPDIRTVVIDRKDGPLEVGLHGYDALNNFFAGILIDAR